MQHAANLQGPPAVAVVLYRADQGKGFVEDGRPAVEERQGDDVKEADLAQSSARVSGFQGFRA